VHNNNVTKRQISWNQRRLSNKIRIDCVIFGYAKWHGKVAN